MLDCQSSGGRSGLATYVSDVCERHREGIFIHLQPGSVNSPRFSLSSANIFREHVDKSFDNRGQRSVL